MRVNFYNSTIVAAPLCHQIQKRWVMAFGFVFSVVSLLQSLCPSPLSPPLPGALDRWALGAVFDLMAHTVTRITPAIISL